MTVHDPADDRFPPGAMCLTAVIAHRVPQVVCACAAAGLRIGVAVHQLPVATLGGTPA
jgi:hypothetical protein